MSELPLAGFQRRLEGVLKQLEAINGRRSSPLCIGIALIRFELRTAQAGDRPRELQRLEAAEIEERVQSCIRQRDYVQRIDDTTVGVIFKGLTSPEHIELAGAKLERALQLPVELLDETLPIRYHAALMINRAGEAAGGLIHRAVTGIMAAARDGTTVSYGETAIATPERDARFEAELEGALAAGEFVPYFQPKFSAAYQTVTGVEVLTRWHSKRRGVQAPAAFIEALESANLIEPFTHRTLRTALSYAQRWREPLPVSVNVPGALLNSDALVIAVRDALELFPLGKGLLTIELTEDSLARDLSDSAKRLRELKALGVNISIDDFGTGYSSLAYLKELPVDELKLDRSFLRDIETDPRAHALVDGIVRMGHALKLTVVAEGVETPDTAATLKALGCDQLQGYLFSKPMPPDVFLEWLGRQLGAA